MKKVIRLTESQLTNVVKKIIKEYTSEMSNYKSDDNVYITKEDYYNLLVPAIGMVRNVLINNVDDGILEYDKNNDYLNGIIRYLQNRDVLEYDTDDEGFDYYYLSDEFAGRPKEELASLIDEAGHSLYDRILKNPRL